MSDVPFEIVEVPAQTSVTVLDEHATIETHKRAEIILGTRGPQGPRGDATGYFERTFIAAETIPALKFVGEFNGGLRVIDPFNYDMRNAGFGVSKTAGVTGASIVVVFGGLMADGAWNWDATRPIMAGAGGALVQDTPIGVAFLQVIGRPVSVDGVLVSVANAVKQG